MRVESDALKSEILSVCVVLVTSPGWLPVRFVRLTRALCPSMGQVIARRIHMPARKHRPDKHGVNPATLISAPSYRKTKLINQLVFAERSRPCDQHYIDYVDTDVALEFVKLGWLTARPTLTDPHTGTRFPSGYFETTHKFRMQFVLHTTQS